MLTSSLLLTYSFNIQALSATTANNIQGTAPFLTFDGGVTKVITIDDLLSIELSDGTRYTPLTNTSTPSNPIVLPNLNETFADVMMVVPTTSSAITLSDVILNNNYWGDDDGDGQGVDAATLSPGSITLTITDKDNQTVNRTDTLDVCKSPYKVVLSSPSGTLATQYGSPNSSSFVASTATYYIQSAGVSVCFVKPQISLGTGDYAGPTSMWNTTKGFIPQSTTMATYGSNFPTTGANGLYFDLDISGSATALTWDPVTVNGITATMTSPTPTSVRVTLIGPTETTTPQLPSGTFATTGSTFELEGKYNGSTVVQYGFTLKKWYINRGDMKATASTHRAWCTGMGYRHSKVNDLTNSSGGEIFVGATPDSGGNHYSRVIGTGLFSEWGQMSMYDANFFKTTSYITSDVDTGTSWLAGYPLIINADTGYTVSVLNSPGYYGICTYP